MSITSLPRRRVIEDHSELEPGDEVEVTYTSSRSGNEVERDGEVEKIGHLANDGDPVVHIYEESPARHKHQYIALVDSGDITAAVSVTAEPELSGFGDRPRLGRTYSASLEVVRKSVLGAVESMVVVSGGAK